MKKTKYAPKGKDTVVYAKVEYKGKRYWWVGNLKWWSAVGACMTAPVQSKDGKRVLLCFRDGSKQFWADRDAVKVIKSYERCGSKTIGQLVEYAKAAREGRICYKCGRIDCAKYGDGCYMCGCSRCEGARGGLCDDD